MDPLTLNILIASIVLLFFMIQGASYFREIKDENTYFLYDRKLCSKEYSISFAAASTSLAAAFFFFVSFGVSHGLFIFLSPFTYAIGAWFYWKVMLPPLEKQAFFGQGTTLGNYIKERYGSNSVKVSIVIVTILGLLSIFLIELFIGVTIFSIYVKKDFMDYALLIIGIAVFFYTAFGGLLAVIKTDKYQFKLILVSLLVFIVWLCVILLKNNNFIGVKELFPHGFIFKSGFMLPVPLLLNMLTVNLLLIPSLLRTWQMAASSPDAKNVKKGIKGGVIYSIILGAFLTFIGISFFKGFPGTDMSIVGILNTMSSSTNKIGMYVVFPLFFAACLAALISTADSALIPIVQSLVQDFRTHKKTYVWKHGKIILLNVLILIISFGLYFVVFRVLKFNLLNWLFTIFSFLILCGPCIIFAILAPSDFLKSKYGKFAALLSIWGGLVIAIMLSYVGNKQQIIALVQLNSPAAAVFGIILFLISYALYIILKNKKGG